MPPFSHVPHVFYLHPTGNAGYGYYIGISFGDMTNVFFFAITFAEAGGQLPSSFR
jgi:hypothetical protein